MCKTRDIVQCSRGRWGLTNKQLVQAKLARGSDANTKEQGGRAAIASGWTREIFGFFLGFFGGFEGSWYMWVKVSSKLKRKLNCATANLDEQATGDEMTRA
ncbi:hypothetical protein METBIDRAFT_170482 [Metschnikowia bicuspidata var. bicuspidata NRRL YB-4993]|uniref:Uncharacterized protein n=1 Tax=Metschnikowia bicuspidata var. bicuspidata NRRL YB-4993 TaxID=869754 RepID=A0A1A0HAF1_9ASCO|nr:hypothetical protein METBIDRAFT_170482 [Metschnikowia bicuspidata var. bicuspidata NRRL YB-4993]OBA20991.1 hypothetical protein METBIDRAFT_170482 [Metschnikowia bicuspidata var. bicuspidata NRRL YB-4993]